MESTNVAAVISTMSDLLEELDDAINAQPRVSATSSSAPIVAWTSKSLLRISAALHTLLPMFNGRIRQLEEHALSTVPPTNTTTSGGVTPGARTTTSQPAGRLPRCKKCFARGHDTDSCRTQNAAAMRKRVAQNSRTARAARAAQALMPSAPPPAFRSFATPAAPIPMEYAALAADATELRRRAAQSRRDKRLHKRPSAASG